MFVGMIQFIILGWFFSWFGLDELLLNVLQNAATIPLEKQHYYLIFAFLGALYGILRCNV